VSEGESISGALPKKSKFKKVFLIFTFVLILAIAGVVVWSRYNFPYGASHACSKVLGMELVGYAGDNDHWFPHGETSPEASLGLLYTNNMDRASWMLGGKIFQHKVVEAQLKQYGKISPATCGWQYIEGLRDDDDPQIMIAWDKPVGLSHNGERTPGSMHEIILIDGMSEFISTNSWKEFISDQKQRLAKLVAARSPNAPRIHWSDEENLGPNLFSPR
jgi:hypothetical protein